MTDYAANRAAEPLQRVNLNAGTVLSEAWGLYKRLFVRSVLIGAVVFGTVHLVQALVVRTGNYSGLLGLFTVVLSIFGVALVQGGLVEIVRGLHVNGDDDVSVLQVLHRASGKVWKLVLVSSLAGLGIGFGFLLLVIPGIILAVRWAVAVPVAMLEEGSTTSALRRSRALLSGNGLSVFMILFICGVLNVVVIIAFTIAAHGGGAFAHWAAATVASALTAPYAAHALTVVYYTLREPERPIVLEPGQRWDSVWNVQDTTHNAPDSTTTEQVPEPIDDELQRRFDEREKRWGG